MRRIYLFIIATILSLNLFSQTHMKFMGVTMDGNINVFCDKLISLGLKLDDEQLKNAVCLKGKFYNEDAFFQVDYDTDTKDVYSVSVNIIKKYGFENCTLQRDILKAVEEKYTYKKETKSRELYQYDYYIFDGYDPVGLIQTFIIDPQIIPSAKESMLNITYVDVENYLKFENRKRNDI